jgi:thiol-disulfide isomerase/thioredoxin
VRTRYTAPVALPVTGIRRVLAALVLVGTLGFVLYAANATPIVPVITAADAADPSRPFVVKLHAQWCPKCMATKGVWSQLEREYGDRANLLVLDFTDAEATAASRTAAQRVGLESIAEEYDGVTGAVLVIDGRTREVTADVSSFAFDDYRAAVDAALGP